MEICSRQVITVTTNVQQGKHGHTLVADEKTNGLMSCGVFYSQHFIIFHKSASLYKKIIMSSDTGT